MQININLQIKSKNKHINTNRNQQSQSQLQFTNYQITNNNIKHHHHQQQKYQNQINHNNTHNIYQKNKSNLNRLNNNQLNQYNQQQYQYHQQNRYHNFNIDNISKNKQFNLINQSNNTTKPSSRKSKTIKNKNKIYPNNNHSQQIKQSFNFQIQKNINKQYHQIKLLNKNKKFKNISSKQQLQNINFNNSFYLQQKKTNNYQYQQEKFNSKIKSQLLNKLNPIQSNDKQYLNYNFSSQKYLKVHQKINQNSIKNNNQSSGKMNIISNNKNKYFKNNKTSLKFNKNSISKKKNQIKYYQSKANSKLKFNFYHQKQQNQQKSIKNASKFSAKKSINLFQQCSETKIKKKGGSSRRESDIHRSSLNFQQQIYKRSLPGISGKKILQKYAPLLSQNQKDQLVNQKTVYYLGVGVNQGEDDNQGTYIWRKHQQIGYRYQLLQAMGKGAFGQVIKSFDHKTKQFVALKIIRAKKQNMQFAMNQINILMKTKQKDIQNQKNIVRIKDFIVFRKHICIITELLNISLYQLMEINKFRPLQIQYIRTFAIQILNALSFLKQNKIIHSDIKPQNILLKNKLKTGVKLIDFGTSMLINQTNYFYIQSRFYRAPEIILRGNYDYSIDMWSFGCLLVELYLGKPLFAGKSQYQQLMMIIQCLNIPSLKFLKQCKNYEKFFHSTGNLKIFSTQIKKQIVPGSKPLQQFIQKEDIQFLRFIKKILIIEPKYRLTPFQALLDPWILQGFPKQLKEDHINYICSKLKKKNNNSLQNNDNNEINEWLNKNSNTKQVLSHKKRNSDFSKLKGLKHNRRRSDGYYI